MKRETWAALTDSADPDAIFASNTSSISITGLATATDRPPKFIGLHFFSPVPVMGLIEIIRGLETDDATHDACRAFAEELGKTVIESRDMPGFLVNRMLGPFINEAVFALMESTGTADRHRYRREARPQPSDGAAGAERLHRQRRDAQRHGRPAPRLRRSEVPRRAAPAPDGHRRPPGPEERARLLPLRRVRAKRSTDGRRDRSGPRRRSRSARRSAASATRSATGRRTRSRPARPHATRRSATTAACSSAPASWA